MAPGPHQLQVTVGGEPSKTLRVPTRRIGLSAQAPLRVLVPDDGVTEPHAKSQNTHCVVDMRGFNQRKPGPGSFWPEKASFMGGKRT